MQEQDTQTSSEIIEALSALTAGDTLSQAQSWQAFEAILAGRATDIQIGALLTSFAFRTTDTGDRGPTLEELTGAAHALRNHVDGIETPEGVVVADITGVGCENAQMFDIATCASFIASGASATIARQCHPEHTQAVMEALGVPLNPTRQMITRALTEVRLCICPPQHLHEAFMNADRLRREIPFPTLLDLLIPLIHPARPLRRLVGVHDPDLMQRIAELLQQLGCTHAMVVHGQSDKRIPLDKLTNTGPTQITHLQDGRITTQTVTPKDLGLKQVSLSALRVENPAASAEKIRDVLQGEAGAARDIAALNAAALLVVTSFADDLQQGLDLAYESIDTGRAQHTLEQLSKITGQS